MDEDDDYTYYDDEDVVADYDPVDHVKVMIKAYMTQCEDDEHKAARIVELLAYGPYNGLDMVTVAINEYLMCEELNRHPNTSLETYTDRIIDLMYGYIKLSKPTINKRQIQAITSNLVTNELIMCFIKFERLNRWFSFIKKYDRVTDVSQASIDDIICTSLFKWINLKKGLAELNALEHELTYLSTVVGVCMLDCTLLLPRMVASRAVAVEQGVKLLDTILYITGGYSRPITREEPQTYYYTEHMSSLRALVMRSNEERYMHRLNFNATIVAIECNPRNGSVYLDALNELYPS